MAGYSDVPTRVLNHRFGAGMSVTEMVSASALVKSDPKTLERLQLHPEEKEVGIQIFGSEPILLAEAVYRISQTISPTCVDLNMGCPVKKISRGGHGAALMRDPEKVYEILSAMVKVSNLPITVKIRSGPGDGQVNYLEVGVAAQEAGVSAITIHPRTRSQGFEGKANWGEIARLKNHLKIPVIGNGDVQSVEDGIAMMEETGCDGIMIGRGAVGNPWLFEQFANYFRGASFDQEPGFSERWEIARVHFELESNCSRNPERAFLRVRKSLVEYFCDFPDFERIVSMIRSAKTNEELKALLAKMECDSKGAIDWEKGFQVMPVTEL